MPKIKGNYKVVRVYDSEKVVQNITEDHNTGKVIGTCMSNCVEKTIRENLTEKQAIDHCNSEYARGTEDGESYRDFYTYM